jgi:hypothetical protein
VEESKLKIVKAPDAFNPAFWEKRFERFYDFPLQSSKPPLSGTAGND